MNLRPSGYEPDELPGCSTPRQRAKARGSQKSETGTRKEADFWCLGAKRKGSETRRLSVVRSSSSVVRYPFFAGLATTYSPMSLRQSTIGAKAFDGRVRDGIGSLSPCNGHQAGEKRISEDGSQKSEDGRKAFFCLRLSDDCRLNEAKLVFAAV